MVGLTETSVWEDEIYQIEQTDPVVAGEPNIGAGLGIPNVPNQQLANRTQWLKDQMTSTAALLSGYVPTTRMISTGSGLTGGGALSANRTLAVDFASQTEAEAGTEAQKAMSPLGVKQAIAAALADLLNGAPTALDTLNELAAALGDDPNFSATITGMISDLTSDLENVGKTSLVETADANNLVTSGPFVLGSGALNKPSENAAHAFVTRYNVNNISQRAIDTVTGDLYVRNKLAGVWGTWGRMLRADEAPQIIAEWEHSEDVNTIDFTDLDDWENLTIVFDLNTANGGQVLLSFDNGSSFETTGYDFALDSGSSSSSYSSGFEMTRGGAGPLVAGEMKLFNLSSRTIAASSIRRGQGVPSGAGNGPAGAVNALRISLASVAQTGSKITIYGNHRRAA